MGGGERGGADTVGVAEVGAAVGATVGDAVGAAVGAAVAFETVVRNSVR
jgi:hypothetical protein